MVSNLANSAATYYASIDALTPKDQLAGNSLQVTQTLLTTRLYALLPYSPFIIVFILLFIAMGIQVYRRVSHAKQNLFVMILAFIIGLTVIGSSFEESQPGFVKAGPDEIPRRVQIQKDSSDSVLVSWHTDTEKTGALRIGKAPLSMYESNIVIANSGLFTKDHTAHIYQLQRGVSYEIEVLSGASWYRAKDTPITFTFN